MMKKSTILNSVLLAANIGFLVVNIFLWSNRNTDNFNIETNGTDSEIVSLDILNTEQPNEIVTHYIDGNEYVDFQNKGNIWTSDSTDTKKIIQLEFMNQDKYPTGCESVTACMALKYMGYDISVDTFIDKYLDKYEMVVQDGMNFSESPYKYFIGDPRSSKGYGCFAPVIEKALAKIIGKDAIHDLSGRSIDFMIEEYVSKGIPIIMWATINMHEPTYGGSWYITSTNQIYTWLGYEHCLLLAGWDETNYYFYDPLKGLVAYEKKLVVRRYKEMGGQALAIVKANGS